MSVESAGDALDPEVEPQVETLEPPLPPIPDGAVMVTVKIARFNPDQPDAYTETGGWQSFRVPCLPSDRLLNLLIYIKGYLDGTMGRSILVWNKVRGP